MNNHDQEQWINDVLGSMKGSRRAQPQTTLFAQIQHQLDKPEARIISARQWRVAAAAAILLLSLNGFALRAYVQSTSTEIAQEQRSSEQLLSDFSIYE